MRTPSLILDYITMLLINDLNMLTVELRQGITKISDGQDQRLPIIEITFENINKSDWFETLNVKLKEFLQGQEFLITKGEENNMFVFLF
ncbi:hypothetical protein ACPUYX_08500 [Desulfosporosinus sp. SYSU MS00001]|uniref:hypothetical protein n=1 Tax=Desulfosporosinus sp. SYSU MS00001 TaxID=3416284 RepID=UPI003CF71EDD